MHSAQELIARWPSLDTTARHARVKNSLQITPGPLAGPIRSQTAAAARASAGLWRREPSVWSADPVVQQTIANRLGWLTSPVLMIESLARLAAFADGVGRDGFTHVVLLGMGGSSLAPEVLRSALPARPGRPRLQMLDSTDPAAVRAIAAPPGTTLYLLASKSGGTVEPNSLAAHFRSRLEHAGVARWADHFVAITDEGTSLARRARAEGFRDIFINPSDIGGRYSALSFFGLVPAALMGHDLAALLGWGVAMLAASEPGGDTARNPAVALGLAIGAAALAGRDKLTVLLPPELRAFGLWIEQLVAESTGKRGVGVIPIVGEPLAPAAAYGTDRMFVCVNRGPETHGEVRALKEAGLPVAAIDLPAPEALGAEFLRWEIATAIAGALLSVNPFDEPNVQQAKDATRVLLEEHRSQGRFALGQPDITLADGLTLTLTTAARTRLAGSGAAASLHLLRPGDYFAVLAFLGPDSALAAHLDRLRVAVRDRLGVATMCGYGPRYLHSTGQLHKGGPDTGVYLLITAAPEVDVAIPGEEFSFGTLEQAQALGDFASLERAGRRAVHAHLPSPDPQLLGSLADTLLQHAPPPESSV
jgi:glucose-6-phosphate isomerase